MKPLALLLLVPLVGCSLTQPTATSTATAAAAPAQSAWSGQPIVMRIRGLHGMTNKADRTVRKQLEAALRARGIRLTSRPSGWTHELRGRFISLNEASATSISYVYDIAPAGGGPSVRITGFERSAGSSSDPWGGVNAAVAQRMAVRSAERIVAKLR